MDSDTRRQLSKLASHALRHRPDKYGLQPDAEGWVTIDDFLRAARATGGVLAGVTVDDLAETIAKADKQRHELNEHSIRALYGHSLEETIMKPRAAPPVVLFHGTSPAAWANIQREGLKPMSRQYVHLSVDQQMARQVGGRRGPQVVILSVRAADASNSGVVFRLGNDRVWLADPIPLSSFRCLWAPRRRHDGGNSWSKITTRGLIRALRDPKGPQPLIIWPKGASRAEATQWSRHAG